MDTNETDKSKVEPPAEDFVEILDLEDDLDTGMHRVNVCKTPL